MTQYIKELRKLIGHMPIVLCGTSVLIMNKQKHLLLQRRTDNHCWGLPGGAVEPRESVEETARREAAEETGLRVGRLTLFGIYSGKAFYYKYPNGDEVYNVVIVYFTSEFEGVMKADGVESKDVRFYSPNNLPMNINPPDRIVLQDYAHKVHELKIGFYK